ncbi:hypothetical protein BaRGS_00018021 [Batillaria attramentaria]|uniref:Uncharacterized protein n=1 Tax=Batillaria attramentaria TaxID=370345 RepID=A0ABD0KUL5_9CAEN
MTHTRGSAKELNLLGQAARAQRSKPQVQGLGKCVNPPPFWRLKYFPSDAATEAISVPSQGRQTDVRVRGDSFGSKLRSMPSNVRQTWSSVRK